MAARMANTTAATLDTKEPVRSKVLRFNICYDFPSV
jgi:hypothetical protein